jgi:hypothetical protein
MGRWAQPSIIALNAAKEADPRRDTKMFQESAAFSQRSTKRLGPIRLWLRPSCEAGHLNAPKRARRFFPQQ